jgi:dTDP-4-dehydrorhamnose reductase
MKILLLGKNGQLGQVLNQTLPQLGKVIATTREQINLENLQDIPNQLKSIQPDIIINAAAYTNVDQAEIEQEKALIINAKAPAILAQYCKLQNIPFIHFSTDYVFDGTQQEPYTETDTPNPLNFYGKSKLLGEQAIQEQQATYLIFRTSWVYSNEGHNFPNTILKLAQSKKELQIIQDQWGAPTHVDQLSKITLKCIPQLQLNKQLSGLYHLTPKGKTNWYEFASVVLEKAPNPHKTKILPIQAKDFPSKTTRPQNSLLKTEKLEKHFDLLLEDWMVYLNQFNQNKNNKIQLNGTTA